jgi:hypothetical protein
MQFISTAFYMVFAFSFVNLSFSISYKFSPAYYPSKKLYILSYHLGYMSQNSLFYLYLCFFGHLGFNFGMWRHMLW